MKRTKIVATIGPASQEEDIITDMVNSGMNVARLNFSHGDYDWHKRIIKILRRVEEKTGIPIGILADLQGPRIRTVVEEEVIVRKGETVELYDFSTWGKRNKRSKNKQFALDYPRVINKIKKGSDVLVEDGIIRFRVVGKGKGYLTIEVIDPGVIKNHKGVNLPGAELKINTITPKDEKDLKFALAHNVDFIALSFVSSGDDIHDLRHKIEKILGRKKELPQIIAKIERREAIDNLKDILKETDAVMVARGDLGIEMDESRITILQKEIISDSLKNCKPVIVATQMLNSMIENPRPTRAEVSDVSNAVIDHADAVMLSGESANGRYPVESVFTMRKIIENTEESPFDDLEHGFLGDSKASVSAAIANSAHELSKDSNAKAIVVASVSGFTARMIARHRPLQPIYVMTNSPKTHSQMTLLWGTESFILHECRNLDELIIQSVDTLKKNKLVKKKDKIVIVTGRPHASREHMSLVKVEEI
jgi:pyruvate kinase